MTAKRHPRGSRNAGFTLAETVMVTGLMAVFFVAVALAYQTGMMIQIGFMSHVPIAASTAAMSTVLRDKARSATCVVSPGPGGSGDTLLGYYGQDCSKTAFDPSVETGYFAFCRAADSRLLFIHNGVDPTLNPTNSPDSVSCGDAALGTWYTLTPLGMVAEPAAAGQYLFSRPASPGNVVYVQALLRNPLASDQARRWSAGADANADPAVLWVSTFTVQQRAMP